MTVTPSKPTTRRVPTYGEALSVWHSQAYDWGWTDACRGIERSRRIEAAARDLVRALLRDDDFGPELGRMCAVLSSNDHMIDDEGTKQ